MFIASHEDYNLRGLLQACVKYFCFDCICKSDIPTVNGYVTANMLTCLVYKLEGWRVDRKLGVNLFTKARLVFKLGTT